MKKNTLKKELDWVSMLVPLAIVLTVCALFMIFPEGSKLVLSVVRGFLGDDFGLYYNLTQNVIFAGVQTNVQEFYQAMDVFAFPSLYEGLGIVLIEAQASGLPCCVSDSVSQEAILTKLIQRRPLRDGALAWAKWILSRKDEPRHDTTAEIQQAGYDIRTTTLWLQHFYEDAVKKHG